MQLRQLIHTDLDPQGCCGGRDPVTKGEVGFYVEHRRPVHDVGPPQCQAVSLDGDNLAG